LTILALISGVVLTGCTDTGSGQAIPAGQTTTKSSGPSGSAPSAIPPRPRDITLEGVDPCKLFTKAQLDQIMVTRQRNQVQQAEVFKGSPFCAMDGGDGQVFWDYAAWLVTTEGIEPWLDGKRNVDAKLVSIAGFPAASYKIRGTTTFNCWTAIGVANGQQMAVEFRPSRNTFTQEQMCEKSQQAATLAVQTLQTLK
jgi:hypothetical protein